MSALPAATVEMINGLSDRNTRRLVRFIKDLRKEEMPPHAGGERGENAGFPRARGYEVTLEGNGTHGVSEGL